MLLLLGRLVLWWQAGGEFQWQFPASLDNGVDGFHTFQASLHATHKGPTSHTPMSSIRLSCRASRSSLTSRACLLQMLHSSFQQFALRYFEQLQPHFCSTPTCDSSLPTLVQQHPSSSSSSIVVVTNRLFLQVLLETRSVD